MVKYAYNPNPAKCAKAYGRGLRISTKSSVIVCRKITGMNLQKGKSFLEALLNKKASINGKHYTNISSELLSLLTSAENNAEFKGMDTERMIIHASAHRGFTYYTPRNAKRRREKRKMTNIQVVLEQR